MQHSNSLGHQKGEGLLRLQQIQKGFPEEEEELGAIFKIRKCPAEENGKSKKCMAFHWFQIAFIVDWKSNMNSSFETFVPAINN